MVALSPHAAAEKQPRALAAFACLGPRGEHKAITATLLGHPGTRQEKSLTIPSAMAVRRQMDTEVETTLDRSQARLPRKGDPTTRSYSSKETK